MEACPWAVIGGSPHPAAMVLKDGTANGESHAHTGGLGGVERIEDPPYGVRVKPVPSLRRLPARGPASTFRVVITSSRARSLTLLIASMTIHDQVQHYLLQLNQIAENRKKRHPQTAFGSSRSFFRFVPDDSEDFPDCVIQVQLFSRRAQSFLSGPECGRSLHRLASRRERCRGQLHGLRPG